MLHCHQQNQAILHVKYYSQPGCVKIYPQATQTKVRGIMWTSTLDLDPKRIFLTQLLGRFWPGAYFSFSAPLQVQNVPRQALAASNWVRVRNRLAGICGSDLHLIYVKGD